MTLETIPLAEITRRAIELLSRELGSANTIRFINQFTTGYGDYTSERDALFGADTLDQIISAIRNTAPDEEASERPSP